VAGRRTWGAVRRLPSGRYQAQWLNPDTHQLTPAPQTFPTKTDAGRWLDAKRTDLDRGLAIDDRAGNRPLREWWPGYLQSLAGLKPSTAVNYETAWRLRVEPTFGGISVRRIRPSHIEKWITEMSAQGVSAAKVGGAHGVLRRVLDRAVRDRVIAANPAVLRRGALPRKTHREHPVLTPAQVEKIARAMKRDDDKTIVRLLAYGGLRIGEALALRRSNLDPVGHTLTIRESAGEVHGRLVVGPTKTYAVRTITLPTSLSAELALRLANRPGDPDTVIFANKHGNHRRYRIWMRDSWAKAIKETKVAATPHDLRSTCASLLIDAGASVKDVQQHLGHSSVITTMTIYAKVRPGRSADLASKLDALIAES
jgi:integrase